MSVVMPTAPAPAAPAPGRPGASSGTGDTFAATLAAAAGEQTSTGAAPTADREGSADADNPVPDEGSPTTGDGATAPPGADSAPAVTPPPAFHLTTGTVPVTAPEAGAHDGAPATATDTTATGAAAPEQTPAEVPPPAASTSTSAPAVPAEAGPVAPATATNAAAGVTSGAPAAEPPTPAGATAPAAALAAPKAVGAPAAAAAASPAAGTAASDAAAATAPDVGTAAGDRSAAGSPDAAVPVGERPAVPVAERPAGPATAVEAAVRVEVPSVRTETVARAEPASPAPPAPPAPQPMSTQLAGTLARLRTAPEGTHILNIRVDPEDLGPVRVTAHIGAEGVRIELFGVTDAARDALRGALSELRRDLAATGLQADLDLAADDGPGDRPERAATGERGREPQPRTAATPTPPTPAPSAHAGSLDLLA